MLRAKLIGGIFVVTMDDMNRRILEMLEKNGRATYQEVAKKLRRSESTVRERIKGMEAAGVILGYTAIINKKHMGFNTEGLLLCNAEPSRVYELINRLGELEAVVHVFSLTGERRIAVRLIARDNGELENIVRNEILPLGVTEVSLHVVTGSEIGLCVKPR